MKIAVYTIAKNEEAYAARWAESSKDADYRVVLDTGSTDRTVTTLKEHGVEVYEAAIVPWRFDEARNQALSRVPKDADVCISLDMDEVLRPGWRAALEAAWTPATTLLRHPLYPKWSNDHSAPEGYYGYVGRTHAREGYQWHYALHEVLRPLSAHVETFSDAFVIDHHTDHKKDKTLYSKMLQELAMAEPQEPRYAYYRAIDLFNAGEHEGAIGELVRYLQLEDRSAGDQRGFALRMMVRAKRALKEPVSACVPLLHRATAEAPEERESWVEMAEACAQVGNWPNALSAAVNALRCTDPRKSFQVAIEDWQGKPERLLELSAKELHIPQEALDALKKQIGA